MKKSFYVLTLIVLLLTSCGQRASQDSLSTLPEDSYAPREYAASKQHSPCSLPKGFYSLREYADALIRLQEKISATSPGSVERVISEREFFELFPTTFDCYYHLYGAMGSLLEQYSLDHVETLFSMHSIDAQKFVTRLIGLALHGTWEADGVGYLSFNLLTHLSNSLPQYVEQLSAYSDTEILSFWYFLYDGPHPDDPEFQRIFQELYSQCKTLNPRVAGLMRQAYEKLLSEKRCSGH